MNNISATDNLAAQPAGNAYQPSNEMGGQDFIQLMLAQMKNQDPTKPLDPNEFMSQLAQFSTVNGIQGLQESFDLFATNMSSDQTYQAAALIGRDVLVPGDLGSLSEGSTLAGQALLPAAANDLMIKIYDQNGVQIRSIPMGEHSAGAVAFQWDGFKDDGSAAAAGNYSIVAEATIDGSLLALETGMQTRVDSVALNHFAGGAVLNLANGTAVPMSAVYQIM